MKTAYCIQCRKVTIMTRTLSFVPGVDDAGKIKKTTIETYHCSSCGSFADSGKTALEKPRRRVGLS